MIYEEIETLRGRRVKRVKTSVFYWSGLVFFIVGVVLIYHEMMMGALLILTLFPCLMLYPIVRFLFGGRDSLGAVVTTAIVEEVLKNEIKNIGQDKKKRKR